MTEQAKLCGKAIRPSEGVEYFCTKKSGHQGTCKLTVATEPRVEAGDRALETARKDFEKWAKGPKLPLEWDGFLYAEYMTQLAWMAWKARESAMNAQDEATETRWQNAIYELCKKMVGPENDHLIDGGGCDSGDALDFTLAEIGQAIGFWQDEADAMNAQEREWREALTKASNLLGNPAWIRRLLAERGGTQ